MKTIIYLIISLSLFSACIQKGKQNSADSNKSSLSEVTDSVKEQNDTLQTDNNISNNDTIPINSTSINFSEFKLLLDTLRSGISTISLTMKLNRNSTGH